MIAGIGIDMVSISRLGAKISKPEFKQAVFTENEIQYCESNANKEQHYAARFAIKEAFLKATGKGLAYDVDTLKQIEAYHKPEGQPAIRLTGVFETRQKTEGWTIHVSVSHENDNAIAIVILEK
jgi:holo-[acyl-carrier protein] synthase